MAFFSVDKDDLTIQFKKHGSDFNRKMAKITNNESYNTSVVRSNVFAMYEYIDEFDEEKKTDKHFGKLCEVMKECLDKTPIQVLLALGYITFNGLTEYFKKDSVVVTDTKMGKDMLGFKITGINIRVNRNIFGDEHTSMYVKGNLLVFEKNIIQKYPITKKIDQFDNIIKITDLPVQVATLEQIEYLTNRGKRILESCKKNSHLYCSDEMFTFSWFGGKSRCCNRGQIIIDHSKLNSGMSLCPTGHNSSYYDEDDISYLDELYAFNNYVLAYNIKYKVWGYAYIENLHPIVYNDKAFDSLVCDSETKKIIKTLITTYDSTPTDVVSEKNRGCVFLFYGTPGTGKTLTCESTAELLHKPLYSVTAGELGCTSIEIESKLQNVIDAAKMWNCLLLLDECDIFLERREMGNIEKNAIVSIFLRMIEKFDGVLFLTTNRIDTIDDAFKSRFSITVHYKPLDAPMRKDIWSSLLKFANIYEALSDGEITEFSKITLNGRQINNIIRMGMALAKHEGRIVRPEDFKSVLKYIMY